MRQTVCYTSVAPYGTLDAAPMYPEIILVTILILSTGNGEKATSYVSVSKGKEGGYSYEVIHDYPTKDSTASVHVFNDDYGDKSPDLSYDYGSKFAADVAKLAAEAVPGPAIPQRLPAKRNPARGRGKKANGFENVPFHNNPVNDINAYGAIKHSATAAGNAKPLGQVHSSTYVNIKHNTRAQSSGTGHLKTQGAASYSYDIGNSVFPKGADFHGNKALSDGKANPLDTGGGIRASASGPGFAFSGPETIQGLSGDYGPVSGPIIYHHHHYHGDSVKDDGFDKPKDDDFNFGKGFFGKTKEQSFHQNEHSFHQNEQSFQQNDHSFHQNDQSFHQKDQSYWNPPSHSGGSISIEATLGHTCATGEVTPLPHFHPRKPDDGVFSYAQDYGYGHGSDSHLGDFNGYDYPAPLQNFHTKHVPNAPHNGGKKGKWKPVIITSSQNKGKLHTFRISKDFKPGKLMGGFKPSFGPPGHHKTAGHLRSFGHDSGSLFDGHFSSLYNTKNAAHDAGNFGVQKEPFADFHDAPFFDYDSILSSLENGPVDHPPNDESPNHSFDEFSDYNYEGGEKSLKDYHNSLTYPSKQPYRRSKKIANTASLSSKPIVVPPLKTTTVHSSTIVASPIPGVDVKSFLDSPSPLAHHATGISSRNSPLNSESDQATSYANPNNLSVRRNNKRKSG